MAVSYLRTGHGKGDTRQKDQQNVLCSETQILVYVAIILQAYLISLR